MPGAETKDAAVLEPSDPRVSESSPRHDPPRGVIAEWTITILLLLFGTTTLMQAFVIPTGSMAPTLMGRHKDVVCPECGYRYSASGSEEADHYGNVRPGIDHQIIECTCPVCRFPMSVDPLRDEAGGAANPSYSGDRIWVSKVPYNFADPQRW
ncbi:MAG: hypothetical protein HY236_10085, partial [Acidobacteria bacterium]|nr:hypothetical protein [Acidobacteriota bacterium]